MMKTMIIALMMRSLSGIKGMKNGRPRKQKQKKVLLTITWHPHPVIDWCMSEDEKQETENLFLST